jgi:alpha-tubulin suppressor-like RCC1 family protein
MVRQFRARDFGRLARVFRLVALGLGLALLGVTFETFAALSPGSIVAWGGSAPGAITPAESSNGATVAIAAASGHTMALLSSGGVVAWGSNGSGESNVPEAATHDVVAIAAGYNHSMALNSTGRVIVWGSNSAGQGNVPDSAQSDVIQIAAGDSHCLALRKDGSVVAWGANGSGQSLVPTAALSGIGRIGAGAFHSLAVTTTGSVVAWGNNLFGQIGSANGELPASLMSGVTAVAGGRYHSAFLKSDGSVVGLGGVGYGESNVPTSANSQVIAIACGNNHTLALKADGSVVGWGDSGNGQSKVPASLPASGYEAVAAGEIFSVALVSDPLPVILQNPQPLTVWAGRTATLSAAAFAGGLQWQRNGVDLPGETGTTFTLAAAKLTDAGMYTVVARNSSGSVTSAPPAELTVKWPTAPVVTEPPRDTTLREGMSYGALITLVTGDDLSFQWTKDGTAVPGRTFSSYGLGVAQLSWSGVYAVIATNAAGSATSAPPARITVLPAKVPVITMTPIGVTVSARSSHVVLVAQTEADAVFGFEWLKDGSVIPGHSGNGFVFPNAYTTELDLGFPEVDASGGYSIRIYSNAGVFTSAVVQVVVTPYVPAPPVITSAPTGSTATQGDSVRLDVVAAGSGLRYQWIKNDVDLPGKTAASLVLASANLADSGSYRVRVTNDDGSVTSDPPAVLVVNALAPVTIVTPPIGAALTAGDPLRLSVVAAGNPKTYQWKRNGTAIYGATNSIYRLVRSMTRHAGEYTVEVGNGFSTTTSSPPAVVTVAPDPNAPPTGGVVELEPALDLSNSGGFYYDSWADISVPPEAQKGVVAITSFRSSIGQSNAFTFNTLFYTGYSVHRLALLEDGRVVSWGYAFNSNPFSVGSNRFSSSSWAYVDSAPEDAEGILAVQCDRQDFTLWPNGSISGFAPPDLLDDSAAFVAISSAPILSQQAAGRGPVAVDTHLLALRNSGEVVEIQSGGPVPALAKSGVRAIAAGPQHSVALREDGSVVAWTVPSGELVPVPSSMSSQVSGITADETGFGALLNDGTLLYKPLEGAVITVPPQPGVVIKSGTPSFAITTDRRAVTWNGSAWNAANVPAWTQGRILQRSGTCLLVNEGAPIILGTIPDQTVEEVKPVTMTVQGGGAGAKFQWFRDGVALPDRTNAVLALSHALPVDAGNYTVSISNAFGSVTSSPPARLTVTPAPNVGAYIELLGGPGVESVLEVELPSALRRGAVQVAAGPNHYLTLRYDGSVVGWVPESLTKPYPFGFGGHFFYKYGLANVGQADVPQEASHDVIDLLVLGDTSIALRSDGAVIAWGRNTSFQIPPSSIRTIQGGGGGYFITGAGGVVVRNGNSVTDAGIPAAARSGVVALGCQSSTLSYALLASGSIVALGSTPVPAEAQSGIVAIQGFQQETDYVRAIKGDGSRLTWNSSGVVTVTPPAARDEGLFASEGANNWSKLFYSEVGALDQLAAAGVKIPDNWRGRILNLGGKGVFPFHVFALLRSVSQTIQFDPIPDQEIKNGALVLSATSGSGLPVKFRVVTGPAVINGSQLSFQGIGQVTVAAEQAGDAVTSQAVPVTRSFTIRSSEQSIQFDPVPPLVFGGGPVALSATASSGLPVTFSVLSGPGTLDGNRLTPTGAGSIVVSADQSGNGEYQSASASRTIVVNPAPQTIAFAPLTDVSFSTTPIPLIATSSSSLPVSFRVLSGPAGLSGTLLSLTGVGLVTVSAEQSGNANFAAATPVVRTFTVGRRAQTIPFERIPSQSFSQTPIPLVASSSAGLAVSFFVLSGPATVNGNALMLNGAGTVVVLAVQLGDALNESASASQSIVVTPSEQQIAFALAEVLEYTSTPLTLGASSSSTLPVSLRVVSGPALLAGNQLTLTGSGTVVVTAEQSGNTNYKSAVPVTRSLQVSKARQTLSFNLPASVDRAATPSLTLTAIATASSGLPVQFAVVSGPAVLNGAVLNLLTAGTVVVSASQPGDDRYLAVSESRTIIVSGGLAQVISLERPSDRAYAPGLVIPLTASANSGLPVTLTLNEGPGELTAAGLSIQGAGSFRITATQAGDATYAAADPVSVTFVITKASQKLSVADVGSRAFGSDPIPLQGSSSSGLPVSFSVVEGSASIENGALKLNGIGVVKLAADQPGNANYEAAARVLQTVEVLPGVTVTPAPTGNPAPATLEVFLPSGVTGEVEQCDVLGNWISIGSVKGGGPGTPATLLVIPPGGQAFSRYWRIRVGP